MGLKILYGENPGGLMDACLDQICTEAAKCPQKRAFLIVPEQTKADMERRYLEARQRADAREGRSKPDSSNALMLVDVVSFHRFAHRILSEVGGYPQNFLDESSKSMMIHQILNDGKDDFKILSALRDRMGFVPDIENVLGDFSRYHVTSQRLRTIPGESTDPLFADKMADFALLIERLTSRQSQLGLSEQGEEMLLLAQVLADFFLCINHKAPWPLSRLSYLPDASVWVLGFGQIRDFTPQEWDVLDPLYKICENLTISICADRIPSSKAQIQEGSGVFAFGRQTIFHLLERFPQNSILCRIESPKTKNAALAHLADAYAERSRDAYEGESDSVHRVFSKNKMDELHFTAGEIKRLVLTEGFRYNDIRVVLCDRSAYESNLHAVFAQYGLDPFLDKRRPLSGTVLVRFVLSLLDLGIEGWSFRPLMTCLKSGMCHITSDDADRLENYCLKHGLFKNFRIFYMDSYSKEKDRDGPYVREIVERVLMPIQTFVKTISVTKTCAGKAAGILTFLDTYGSSLSGSLNGVAGQVDALAKEWTAARDQEAALALVSSYNELVKLLRKLVGPIGEMNISLLNFKSMLSSGMDAAFSGAIPSYVDMLQISDTRRGYQRSCKAMFLVGAKSDNFPYKAIREGFLRGFERELLSRALRITFPSREKDQVYADTFTAYALLSCPSERLYLTCPSDVTPSPVFTMIPEVLPYAVTHDQMSPDGHDPRLFSRTALQRFVWSGLSDTSGGISEKQELCKRLAKTFPVLSLPLNPVSSNTNVLLEPGKVDLRYDAIVKMSVSQIESYASCPFRHFSQYLLGLREREIFQVAVNDIGTILHRMFELSLADYCKQQKNAQGPEEKEDVYQRFCAADYPAWASKLFHTVSLENTTPISKDISYLGNAGSKIIRIASHSLRAIFRDISPDGFEPDRMEWSFGGDQNAKLDLQLPSGRIIQFRGVIDRVDLDRKDGAYRIVDYKSGNKKIDYEMLYDGLSLQLPAYVYAYGRQNPDYSPADAGYFYLTAPMISVSGFCGKPSEDAMNKSIDKEYSLRSLKLSGEDLKLAGEYAVSKMYQHCQSLFSGSFSAAPRIPSGNSAKPFCEYCDFMPVCGIDPSRPPCLILPSIPPVIREDGKREGSKEAFIAGIQKALLNKGGVPT